jgi:hypothetical protein
MIEVADDRGCRSRVNTEQSQGGRLNDSVLSNFFPHISPAILEFFRCLAVEDLLL